MIQLDLQQASYLTFTVFFKKKQKNLLNFGEEDFRIFVTGNPSYTNIINQKKINLNNISNKLGIKLIKNKFIVFIQHPISSEYGMTEKFFRFTESNF